MLAGEPTAKGTGLGVPAGKEDPVEFDSSLTECSSMEGVAQVRNARQLMALIMAFAAIWTVGSSFLLDDEASRCYAQACNEIPLPPQPLY